MLVWQISTVESRHDESWSNQWWIFFSKTHNKWADIEHIFLESEMFTTPTGKNNGTSLVDKTVTYDAEYTDI